MSRVATWSNDEVMRALEGVMSRSRERAGGSRAGGHGYDVQKLAAEVSCAVGAVVGVQWAVKELGQVGEILRACVAERKESDWRMVEQQAVARCVMIWKAVAISDALYEGGGQLVSEEERRELLAWHIMAQGADKLTDVWRMCVGSGRLESLKARLAGVLGYEAKRWGTKFGTPNKLFVYWTEGKFFGGSVLMQAVVVYPEATSLHRALQKGARGWFDRGGCAFRSRAYSEGVEGNIWRLEGWMGGKTWVEVCVGADGALLAVDAGEELEQVGQDVVGGTRRSAMLDDRFRWPCDKEVPKFDIVSCLLAERDGKEWSKALKGCMTAACAAVLGGRFTIPFKCDHIKPFVRENHSTIHREESLVFKLAAKYLLSGALEWCPRSRVNGWGLPKGIRCVCPLGLVPKNSVTEPWRIVHDLRELNQWIWPWPTSMKSLGACADLLFSPGAFCFSRDITSAYHTVPLAGCGRGLFRDGVKQDGTPRWRVGCTPETCGNACDKSTLGVKIGGEYFRFAVPPFGMKISNQGLASLLDPLLRRWRLKGHRVLCWVDDLLFVVWNECRELGRCGGENGGCSKCARAWQEATRFEREVDEELARLGLLTNEKNCGPSQRGMFLGLSYDTVRGVLFVDPEKAEELAEKFAGYARVGVHMSRRELAQVRGKLLWFAPCLAHVKLLSREMSRYIGSPKEDEDWDTSEMLPEAVREELAFWGENLVSMAKTAKPIWRMPPQRLKELFMHRESALSHVVLTDASYMGWGATLIVNGIQKVQTSGEYPPELDFNDQAQREIAGTALAIQALTRHIAGNVVLHLTDCKAVESASAKGSASHVMQSVAIRLWRWCAANHIDLISAWVPGDYMVSEGVDELSREGTVDVHGLAVTDETWEVARGLSLKTFNSHCTVDLFASRVNTRCDRFWARGHDAGCEGADALAASSWLKCPCNCERGCREICWAFPPVPMLTRFWARAQSEGARGVALVPYTTAAVWWPVLVWGAASEVVGLPPGVDALKLPQGASYDSDPRADSGWSLVAFDFSKQSSDHIPCAQAAVRQEISREKEAEMLAWSRRSLAVASAGDVERQARRDVGQW